MEKTLLVDLGEDPIATFGLWLENTPVTESVRPIYLRSFHVWCKRVFSEDTVDIDEEALIEETNQRDLISSLVMAEMFLALSRFDFVAKLGQVLFACHPMDHRVQDVLFRARYYQRQGCLPENPGFELQGKFCPMLTNTMHILPGGEICQCCAVWLRTSIGNLFQQSIMESWSSQRAKELWESAMSGDYRFCGKLACPHIQRAMLEDNALAREFWLEEIPVRQTLPTRFNLSYDKTCNLACPSCRSQRISAKGFEFEQIEQATDRLISFTDERRAHGGNRSWRSICE